MKKIEYNTMKITCQLLFLAILLNSVRLFANGDDINHRIAAKYAQAEHSFNSKNYTEALAVYHEIATEVNTSNIKYHIGLCYLNMPARKDKEKSLSYFEKVIDSVCVNYADEFDEKHTSIEAYYYLAEAYFTHHDADKSMQMLQKFMPLAKNAESVERAGKLQESCEKLKKNFVFSDNESMVISKINKQPLNLSVSIILNSQKVFCFTHDYQLVYSTLDSRVFAQKYNLNKKNWEKPKELFLTSQDSSSVLNERIFVAKNSGENNIDLYETDLKSLKTISPHKLNENINSKYDETSGCISKDGVTFYFSSNRKGGYGGYDLYKVEKKNNGEWGRAENLGPTINSEHDEIMPSILSDNVTLYFSSNGHNSMGGYDVFESTISEEGAWVKPGNIGFPINTVNDELSFFVSVDEKNAFYISSKDHESFNMYQIELQK